MTNNNPSRGARALVLAGPALALLATLFCLVNESWSPPARGPLVRCGAVDLPRRARSTSCGGDSTIGDWSTFNRHELSRR